MKQRYLLFAFLLLTAAASAQQKFEAGFTVKAGTFTWQPSQKTETSLTTFQPGTTSSFGVFALRRLGKRWGISSELLYNFSAYKEHFEYAYQSQEGLFAYNIDRNFHVQSFLMPLRVHLYPKKNGRTSLSAGLTPCFILTSDLKTVYSDNYGYSYSTTGQDLVTRKDGSEGVQLFFTFGGSYRIDDQTSAGLEFTGSPDSNSTEFYPDVSFCGTGYTEHYPFWMRSIAVTLRHNILH